MGKCKYFAVRRAHEPNRTEFALGIAALADVLLRYAVTNAGNGADFENSLPRVQKLDSISSVKMEFRVCPGGLKGVFL